MSAAAQPHHRVALKSLRVRRLPIAAPSIQLQKLADVPLRRDFAETLGEHGHLPLRRGPVEVLQVNVGKVCNQTCRHCHVDAGPDRKESISREVLSACLSVLRGGKIPTVDITGGAPEIHPDFCWFVTEASQLNVKVMNRCNLTILLSPTCRELPTFFAKHRVELVCSLPHYRRYNTDRQRGEGVFDKSIKALKRLNEVGYGRDPNLRITLVTNPAGAFLPGDQSSMEREWRRELKTRHGVSFDALFTLTNLPIARYLEWLDETDNLESYVCRLERSFNPATVPALMCRTTLSVGWDGTLYDCDFNQMLEIPIAEEQPMSIMDIDTDKLNGWHVQTNRHCFGCTAGAGSSCGGSLAT